MKKTLKKEEYPIFSRRGNGSKVRIYIKENSLANPDRAAEYTVDPTYNCSLCSLGGVDELLTYEGALAYALNNMPKNMALLDINTHNLEDVLAICKRNKNRIIARKTYESTTGSSMVLLVVATKGM